MLYADRLISHGDSVSAKRNLTAPRSSSLSPTSSELHTSSSPKKIPKSKRATFREEGKQKQEIDLMQILSSPPSDTNRKLNFFSVSFQPPLLSLSHEENMLLRSSPKCEASGGRVGCVFTMSMLARNTSREGCTSQLKKECVFDEDISINSGTAHGGSVNLFQLEEESVVKSTSIDHLASQLAGALQPFVCRSSVKDRMSEAGLCEQLGADVHLNQAVYDLVCKQEDDLNIIMDAVRCFRTARATFTLGHGMVHADHSETERARNGRINDSKGNESNVRQKKTVDRLVGDDELAWWADTSHIHLPSGKRSQSRRQLAFLRRMLCPLCVRITNDNSLKSEGRDHGQVDETKIHEGRASYDSELTAVAAPTAASDVQSEQTSSEILAKTHQSNAQNTSFAPEVKTSSVERNADCSRSSWMPKQIDLSVTPGGQVDGADIRVMKFSLLDVLLRVDAIQSLVLDALLCRVLQLEHFRFQNWSQDGCSGSSDDTGDLRSNGLGSCAATSHGTEIQLQIMILSAIGRTALNHRIVARDEFIINVQRMLSCCPNPTYLQKILPRHIKIASSEISSEAIQNAKATRIEWEQSGIWRILATHKTTLTTAGISGSMGVNPAAATKGEEGYAWLDMMEAKSCPPGERSERVAIRNERKKLLRKFAEAKKKKEESDECHSLRRSRRKILPQGRSYDGSLIITSDKMSITDFLKRASLMAKVNETFPRRYIPKVSRPSLRQLNFSTSNFSELKAVFFDEDGSLKNEIKHEIDTSVRNDPRYINFKNRACPIERTDMRWQVPIRKHGAGCDIETRSKVESLFKAEGVFSPEHEKVDEIGLLFGGTEDQPLHHDAARQVTSWMFEKPLTDDVMTSLNPIAGWEIDRLEYNHAMESAFAPSSIIVGLGDKNEALLGVQKDRIDRIGDGNSCKIRGGCDEVVPIVRETDYLVVVKLRTGGMFTGDFPHAGVRNIPHGSTEDTLMSLLNKKIADIVATYPAKERVLQTKAMVDMMCNFPGLNKLCRLHCSTEMLGGKVCIPPNTIGFSECLANPPDSRCYEMDDEVDGNQCDDGGTFLFDACRRRDRRIHDDKDDEFSLDSVRAETSACKEFASSK